MSVKIDNQNSPNRLLKLAAYNSSLRMYIVGCGAANKKTVQKSLQITLLSYKIYDTQKWRGNY